MKNYLTNVLTVLVVVACSYGLFQVKYEVDTVNKINQQVANEVALEQDLLKVLNAEWSFLNKPSRLRSLALKHLKLSPLEISQISNPTILSAISSTPRSS